MGLVNTAGGHDSVAPNKSGTFAKKKKQPLAPSFTDKKRKGSFRTRLGNMSGEVMMVVAAVSLAALREEEEEEDARDHVK